MKGLRGIDRFLFFLNSLFAVVLLFSYLLPYIPPSSFALLSVFSLAVPLFIFINIFFLIYWIIRLKRQMLLSLIVLLIGFNHLTSIYEFSPSKEINESDPNISIISYNVRQFNQYEWTDQPDIPGKIASFITKQDPDIISIQEYFSGEFTLADAFSYKYIDLKEKHSEFGLAILSKFPIINKGTLDFSTKSNNNAIYADIVAQGDTLRVVNVHLQSFDVKPQLDKLEKEQSKKVFLGMGRTFVIQEQQMERVMDLVENSPYPVTLMGDFNNTAYSYIYKEVMSLGFQDSYKVKGNGFGRTYDFDYFPLRIDYILTHKELEILSCRIFDIHYSDHLPTETIVKWRKK